MSRKEAQPYWEKVVQRGFDNYDILSREERIWFNIEPLVTDGLWDHYINYGADHNSDTIDDLESLGHDSIARLLREFNGKYFPFTVPVGPDARQEVFDQYPEKELEKDIDNMDSRFWKECKDLEESLLKHLNNWGLIRST